jgi:hypothetical protein
VEQLRRESNHFQVLALRRVKFRFGENVAEAKQTNQRSSQVMTGSTSVRKFTLAAVAHSRSPHLRDKRDLALLRFDGFFLQLLQVFKHFLVVPCNGKTTNERVNALEQNRSHYCKVIWKTIISNETAENSRSVCSE